MSYNTEFGRRGEQVACQYLKENRFSVLHRNWRHAHDELDVVALRGETLHVVEVKTRTAESMPMLSASLNAKKMQALARAAAAYLSQQNLELEVSFDLITVVFSTPEEYAVEHVVGFFHPNW